MALSQFIDIGYHIACAIECLEVAAANPADVYLYWLAVVARMKEVLDTSHLPDGVRGEIRGIINARWREFFVEGPTNVHLTAFYLNPSYVRSSIFAQPNPLLFNIVMPGTQLPQVPPRIRNARTFLAVGKYLHYLLVQEVLHGSDPFLLQ